ncbi:MULTISPECIES: hypothetical protein [unclassified Microcoleus]|uniref:hypothetical protein n=1 Tax=unclassified Microcoleus TaxID=2642155 RepID=UPI002FD12C3D
MGWAEEPVLVIFARALVKRSQDLRIQREIGAKNSNTRVRDVVLGAYPTGDAEKLRVARSHFLGLGNPQFRAFSTLVNIEFPH